MVALDTIRPHLTPNFVAAFRALGKQVGYSKLGRAIAYAKLPAVTTGVEPKVSRNGRRGKHEWFCRGNGRKHTCVCHSVCRECLVNPQHRFTHNPTGIFAYSFLVSGQRGTTAETDSLGRGHRLHAIANAMPKRECCGLPMGVMPDSLDPRRWRYQCAVDPKHQEDTEISIAVSP